MLPPGPAKHRVLDADSIELGRSDELDEAARARLHAGLDALHPWRKGPFALFGLPLDAEWRADWKWRRLAPAISSLVERRVLDVGAGNGYYVLRMLGAGARAVIGIEPMLRSVLQFRALKRYAGGCPGWVLPLSLEEVPAGVGAFDTVFSMGVLYHRRSPLDHLTRLFALLRPGGELVLETLVLPGNGTEVLVPAGRYARMRNVWFIPALGALRQWLVRVGFETPRCVDVSPTTPAEQRSTPWMRFESLCSALDPADPQRTVEGHPAPRRALFIAHRP